MNKLEDFWPQIEEAKPDNPAPLLVCADWCDEEPQQELDHIESFLLCRSDFAYALRWCAGKQMRPFFRVEIKRFPWQWIRDQSFYKSLTRSEVHARRFARLPQAVFDAMPGLGAAQWELSIRKSVYAYQYLALSLKKLRGVVEIPNIIVPPQPSIIRLAPVTCSACGIMRRRDVERCPVCQSSETKGA